MMILKNSKKTALSLKIIPKMVWMKFKKLLMNLPKR